MFFNLTPVSLYSYFGADLIFFFFSFIVKDTSTFFLDLTTQYSSSGPKEYSRGSCFFLELLYQGEVEDLVSDYDLVQTKPESILAL